MFDSLQIDDKIKVMKKVNKTIKIILYVIAVLLFLQLIGVILRPVIQKVEQARTLTKIEKKEPVIVYIQMLFDVDSQYFKVTFKKGELLTARVNPDDLSCVFDYEYNRYAKTFRCFPNNSYRILSTDTEQELIKKAIGSEYGDSFYPDSTIADFRDINKDGIKDAVIYQTSEPTSSIGIQDYTIYSATDNKVLWGISNTINLRGNASSSPLKISTVPNNYESDMIVVFKPKDQKDNNKFYRYSFYKFQTNQYVQIIPTEKDWRNYWKIVSTPNLLLNEM